VRLLLRLLWQRKPRTMYFITRSDDPTPRWRAVGLSSLAAGDDACCWHYYCSRICLSHASSAKALLVLHFMVRWSFFAPHTILYIAYIAFILFVLTSAADPTPPIGLDSLPGAASLIRTHRRRANSFRAISRRTYNTVALRTLYTLINS